MFGSHFFCAGKPTAHCIIEQKYPDFYTVKNAAIIAFLYRFLIMCRNYSSACAACAAAWRSFWSLMISIFLFSCLSPKLLI